MNAISFLLSQAPLFWLLVTGFFFLMGLYWSHLKWSSDRHLLEAATEEQFLLIAERDDALAVEAAAMHGEITEEVELVHAVALDGEDGQDRGRQTTVQAAPTRIRVGTRRRYRNGNHISRDKTDPA